VSTCHSFFGKYPVFWNGSLIVFLSGKEIRTQSYSSKLREYFPFYFLTLTVFPVFLHKFFDSMEQKKKNTAVYWLLFFLSTAALILAIDKRFEYLTLILPFVCTFFVKALDIM
jgi:hypothetical protein